MFRRLTLSGRSFALFPTLRQAERYVDGHILFRNLTSDLSGVCQFVCRSALLNKLS